MFNKWGNGQRKPKQATNNTDGDLRPRFRADGKPVTMRNCHQGECRWPYGVPRPDMLLCGRPAEKSFCEAHEALAFKSLKARQKRLEAFGLYIDANSNSTKEREYD